MASGTNGVWGGRGSQGWPENTKKEVAAAGGRGGAVGLERERREMWFDLVVFFNFSSTLR